MDLDVLKSLDDTKGNNSPSTSSDSIKRFSREEINYCPECCKRNKITLVRRYQLEEDKFLILCPDKKNCLYLREGVGKVPVNKEDLIQCGFPDELLLHMDLYEEDLNKITRFCMYQYFTNKHCSDSSSSNIEHILQEINNDVQLLQTAHGIDSKENYCNIPDQRKFTPRIKHLEKLLEHSISDLSSDYKEKITKAFSKINNYKFPDSLVISIRNLKSYTECAEESCEVEVKTDNDSMNEDLINLLI